MPEAAQLAKLRLRRLRTLLERIRTDLRLAHDAAEACDSNALPRIKRMRQLNNECLDMTNGDKSNGRISHRTD